MKKDSLSDRFFLHNMPFIPPFRHRFACMVLFFEYPVWGWQLKTKGLERRPTLKFSLWKMMKKNASLADLLRRFETDGI